MSAKVFSVLMITRFFGVTDEADLTERKALTQTFKRKNVCITWKREEFRHDSR